MLRVSFSKLMYILSLLSLSIRSVISYMYVCAIYLPVNDGKWRNKAWKMYAFHVSSSNDIYNA